MRNTREKCRLFNLISRFDRIYTLFPSLNNARCKNLANLDFFKMIEMNSKKIERERESVAFNVDRFVSYLTYN